MKKLIFSLSLFLSFSSLVHAQWAISGTNTYYNLSGNVGIGANSFAAKFAVYQATALGSVAKNSLLLSSIGGSATNNVQNNLWLVRNAAGSDFTTARLHDGVSVDGSFLTPQTNTLTWWERDPTQDIQSWGNSANTYVTINKGNLGIGTTTPDEKLVVSGAIKTILDPTPNFSNKNVARILALGGSGITGAQNWAIRGVYQYPNGVALNAVGGDLDLIKSWNANTILSTKSDGTPLGWVGIGTLTPNTRLDVNGVISMNSFAYLSSLRMPANNYTNLFLGGAIKDNADGTYSVYTDGGSNYFSAIKMDNGGNNAGAINFYDGISVSGANYNITNANLANYLRMTISGNGNVGVGIAVPQNKLDVNGTIHSKAVNIDLNGWNDYVFKKDYQLRSLSEVKAYIDQNQHLPEIPSEQEMIKKGLDVSEMNKLLMKKVEELTLYLIDEHKKNKDQQEQINELNKKLELLINKN